eukprot:TRINITY_DN5623_c0_g2_i1.p1 TRINITY_DN5623_c0_g2~~TRINITY_DN5623_c0_g2_i1.p1  ORF type:complete len:327 (+),score=65.52 TRINITY_DN5623_c0_g2_i1:101-982(+)
MKELVKAQRATQDQVEAERREYGRELTPSERVSAPQTHVSGGYLPEAKGVTKSAVELHTLKKDAIRRNRQECIPCCIGMGLVKFTVPIIGAVGVMAASDLSYKRLPRNKIGTYAAAIMLPYIVTTSVVHAALTHVLYSFKPKEHGNLVRGLQYAAISSILLTSLPCFSYHLVRHVLMRPKNISSAAYWNKLNTMSAPYKKGQFVGMWKSLTEVTAFEMGFITMGYTVIISCAIYLYAKLIHGGDAMFLKKGDEYVYACVPHSVVTRLEQAKQEKIARAVAAAGVAPKNDTRED